MRYEVTVSMNIIPKTEEGYTLAGGSSLYHHRSFTVTGKNFTDIAPKIDAVYAAIELVADPQEEQGS